MALSIPKGIIVLFVAYYSLSDRYPWAQGAYSIFWPTREATILQCDDTSILYRYEWDGGTRQSAGYALHTPSAAYTYAFAATHKPGDRIQVWVNPRNPSEAVITRWPDIEGESFLTDIAVIVVIGGVGVMLILGGAFVVARYFWQLRKFQAY
ncbi:hypothetical protein F183_A06450 [Bryobacterales bacterium F-183]|nr:hypothetical protein F183_A06450 [Bryobacterales bacterium F-183]